jgi:hypothetical protein
MKVKLLLKNVGSLPLNIYKDMKLEDLTGLEDRLRGDLSQYSEKDSKCVFNGLIPFPLLTISSSYREDEDIEVIDEYNQPLGLLCFCKSLDEESLENLDSITDAQYIAYIYEVGRDSFELNLPFRFQKNYFVVYEHRYEEYVTKYMEYASLWGGFVHANDVETEHDRAYTFKPSFIKAHSSLAFPTQYHAKKCFRSAEQPYAFERFLQLYHLLELIYDWDFINRLKGLDDDLTDLGIWLKKYSTRDDIDRLKSIFKVRYEEGKLDVESISNSLNEGFPCYLDEAKKIFFEFGKGSNPYKDNMPNFDGFIRGGGFAAENIQRYLGNNFTGRKRDEFVIDVAAYWIYRVRCCIAHNKIGEYVMSHEDEEFVARFAEPLLRTVLLQVFKQ